MRNLHLGQERRSSPRHRLDLVPEAAVAPDSVDGRLGWRRRGTAAPRVGHLLATQGHRVQHNVGGVRLPREFDAERCVQVRLHVAPTTLERGAAARRDDQDLVQRVPDLRARLVHRHRHRQVRLLRHAAQRVHQLQRRVRVQALRRLVEEHGARRRHELHRDRRALTLPAADAARLRVADRHVRHVRKPQRAQRHRHHRLPLRLRPLGRQPQLRRVRHVAVHRQLRVQHVVLRHRPDHRAVLGDVAVAVDAHRAGR
mmetsp:Transcript_60669/g.70351  ORF Transcript_60669/g.70351 Transcript_60669/m.70351 type:complete len:256 (+) Transcript_60669:973-1740(+)